MQRTVSLAIPLALQCCAPDPSFFLRYPGVGDAVIGGEQIPVGSDFRIFTGGGYHGGSQPAEYQLEVIPENRASCKQQELFGSGEEGAWGHACKAEETGEVTLTLLYGLGLSVRKSIKITIVAKPD